MIAEARDQALHALAAALVLAPAAVHPTWWTFALSGALIGLVREVTQHNRVWPLGWGARLDVACWALGGLAVGVML